MFSPELGFLTVPAPVFFLPYLAIRVGFLGHSKTLNNRGALNFRRPQRIDHTPGAPKNRSNLGSPEALGSQEAPLGFPGTATGSLGTHPYMPGGPRRRAPGGVAARSRRPGWHRVAWSGLACL